MLTDLTVLRHRLFDIAREEMRKIDFDGHADAALTDLADALDVFANDADFLLEQAGIIAAREAANPHYFPSQFAAE